MSTPTVYVHHYGSSPFAEKLRAMLGYKGLPWVSVTQPSVMPKPDLVALTGGYRRIPVLQIGADVYVDTALMADVLEHLAPQPTLFPEAIKGAARIVAQWADSTLFWTAMAYNLQPAGAAYLFKDAPPGAAEAFSADRAAMQSPGPRLRPGDSASAYRSYLRRLAHMLESGPYLFGAQPCIADFAAYHTLWFTRNTAPLAGILDSAPGITDWLARMDAFSQASRSNASKAKPAEALEAARNATPRALDGDTFVDLHGIALGSTVTIAAESFGPEPSAGELVAATRTRYTLRRTDERAGTVHVHFPRVGYILRKAS